VLDSGSKLLSCTKNIITYRHVFDNFMMLSHVINVFCLKTNNAMYFSVSTVPYDNFIFPLYKFSTYNRKNEDNQLLIMHVDKSEYAIIVSSA